MTKLPTDLGILEEIYKRYYPVFISFSREQQARSAKVYVPIDIEKIAKHFGVDSDIIFGRLYYHLEHKYGLVYSDGTKASFFSPQIGSDRHCIQFPILGAAIAALREERNKQLMSTWLSIVAVVISFVSLAVSIFARIWR